jgi:hypothetical protein
MIEKQVPARLWDYGVVYVSGILSIIARSPSGRPGMEKVKGETIDITEWLDFKFYDYVVLLRREEDGYDPEATTCWQVARNCPSNR